MAGVAVALVIVKIRDSHGKDSRNHGWKVERYSQIYYNMEQYGSKIGRFFLMINFVW